jgi:hypothetical protein
MEELLKLFFKFGGSRTSANVYSPEYKEEVCIMYITPVLAISRYICPRFFDGYFEIFALSEISTISRHNTNDVCGILVGRMH